MSTQTQMGNMIIYINNDYGQLYAEIDDRLYELEVGVDVTEEIDFSVSELEVIKIFDPGDSIEPDDDKDKFKLIDDEFIF